MIELVDRLPQEDFQLVQNMFTVPVGNIKVANADPTRWGLVFSATTLSGAALTVQPITNIQGNMGILLGGNNAFVILNFKDHGALVSQAWWAFTGTSQGLAVIEILYRPVGKGVIDTDNLPAQGSML